MTSDLLNAELVEAYLSNKLHEPERLIFESKLQSDESLAEFVAVFQDVDNAILEEDVMQLRNSLQSIHEQASEEWIDEAPMLLADSHEMDIERAIIEDDVMRLRSMLNDIHDLNREELADAVNYIPAEENDEFGLTALLEEDVFESSEEFLEKELSSAILQEDIMALRKQLHEIGKGVMAPAKQKVWYHRFSKLTAIASVVLLMLLGGTFWVAMDSMPMKPEKAVAKFFTPPDGRAPTRAAFQPELVSVEAAFENYRNGNYIAAAQVFEALRKSDPNYSTDMEVTAFAGFSLFHAERYTEAAELLSLVVEDKDNVWVDHAQWFLAGCFLRNREMENEGLELLQNIAIKPNHEYLNKSRKLLKELKH